MKGAGSESTGGWIIRGRTISCSDIQSIRELLGERPEASRWALAGALCERWPWRTDNGQGKIRSALGVLNGLAQRGLVVLPAVRGSPSGARSARAVPVKLEGPGGTGLVGPVARYRPLRWELVSTAAERGEWRTLLDQYHYLGAPNLVGPNLKYRVYGKEGELLGALGWHSAVQHLGCRDRLVGWDAAQRARWLGRLYLAEIACTRKVWVRSAPQDPKLETEGCSVEQLVRSKGLLNWQNLRVGEGEKGPLVAGFARVRVYLNAQRTPQSERWLVLRNDANCKIKYALSNAPEDIPFSELVRVSAARWPIERCFQEEKSHLGLDHYEHRTWTAWHRHTRLVSLAQLFRLRLGQRYKKKPQP